MTSGARATRVDVPLTFEPLYMERVWGGRELESRFGRRLPGDAPIGESWEIADRSGAVSRVRGGPWDGRDLRWLMEHHAPDLLGGAIPAPGRFPWLIKILDARERLSLQVHPPASVAGELDGEPKTEMWYVVAADPGAEIHVGVRPGTTPAAFEEAIRNGEVAGFFHRIPVRPGDAMFLPSGRVHAIGAGLVIFEVQQNSDTTYRVFDWNRVGLDGRPRALHVAEALRSIDFGDTAPALVSAGRVVSPDGWARVLVDDPLFRVTEHGAGEGVVRPQPGLAVLAVVSGRMKVSGRGVESVLGPGDFVLVPDAARDAVCRVLDAATWLEVRPGA